MASALQSSSPANAAYLAQSRVPEILFGSIFPAIIATIFVLARFYSRAIIIKNWGWDDTWILLSWLNGGVVLTVLNCVLTHYGSGRHIILLTLFTVQKLDLIGAVCRFLYTICLFTTKLSICALYLRLFIERKDRMIIWLIVAYHTLFTIPIFFGIVFRCSPITANWTLVPGKCLSYSPPLIASSILNICGDISLLAFIIPKLSQIQIGERQRNVLIGVMGIGVLVIIAAAVRLVLLIQELHGGTDYSYESYSAIIWTSVEVNTSLFCAAAPATRPVIFLIAPDLLSNSSGGPLDNTAARISNYATGTVDISNYLPSNNLHELDR